MLLAAVLFAALVLPQDAPAAKPAATPAPVTAQAPTPDPSSTLSTVEVEAEITPITQVCRTEAVTGSRFGRRVCRSSNQTDDERTDSQEMLRQMQGARVPAAG